MKNANDKMLEDVLEAMKQVEDEVNIAKNKRDKKLWKEITFPFTLKDAFSKLTKDELISIRQELNIKNVSHLKKGELAELLSEEYLKVFPYFWDTLDEERYQFFNSLVNSDGKIVVNSIDKIYIHHYLNKRIIFSGEFQEKRIIGMPEEFLKQFKQQSFNYVIERNTEWILLTQGLLYYYGTLHISELIDLVEKHTGELIDSSVFLDVIFEAMNSYDEIYADEYGISNAAVVDPKRVLKEHGNRSDVAYFPFTKMQLFKAGKNDYIERDESYFRFVNYLLNNFEMNREDAEEITEEGIFDIQNGDSPNDLFKNMQEFLEFDDFESVNECMGEIVYLMNNTKQWFLKGHAPAELSKHPNHLRLVNKEVVSSLKIGRNDPCTCGSGKKYKKCCGQ